jgi:hypothetical protein
MVRWKNNIKLELHDVVRSMYRIDLSKDREKYRAILKVLTDICGFIKCGNILD